MGRVHDLGMKLKAVEPARVVGDEREGRRLRAPDRAETLRQAGHQTAGILVGSVNRFKEKVVLAKVVKAIFDCEVFPGQTIRFDAQLERMDDQGASTTGIVQRQISADLDSQWETIGRIDLMFSHLDQNRAGLEFPKENFVFAENFKEILQQAGLENLADS